MRHEKLLEDDTRDVTSALAIEEGLTDWEVMFVESIGRQVLDSKKLLSARQREHLDEILRKHDR